MFRVWNEVKDSSSPARWFVGPLRSVNEEDFPFERLSVENPREPSFQMPSWSSWRQAGAWHKVVSSHPSTCDLSLWFEIEALDAWSPGLGSEDSSGVGPDCRLGGSVWGPRAGPDARGFFHLPAWPVPHPPGLLGSP